MATQPWNEFLQLPTPIASKRLSKRDPIMPGKTVRYRVDGKGCVKHWWFTYMYTPTDDAGQQDKLKAVHHINLKIYFDNNPVPSVDQPLDTFFGTFLDLNPVELNSMPLTVLKRNAFNAWFPMPFSEAFVLELTNHNEQKIITWFMADLHLYDEGANITPLRFATKYQKLQPARDYAFMEMGEITGKGFIAGIFHGTDATCQTDSWYHTGGDTWLIDGETRPNIIRGNGGEDVAGYSFGIYQSGYLWQGAPYVACEDGVGGGNTPCIFYRFFGPDAIVFQNSAICKFGTKEARIETNLYYYADNQAQGKINTIDQWHVCGPFDGGSEEAFEKSEFPEHEAPSNRTFSTDLHSWQPNTARPEQVRPKPYVGRWESAKSKRGWIDFLDYFRGINFTNVAAGGNGGAAYALGMYHADETTDAVLRISYDDRIKVWLNDTLIHNTAHEDGFQEACVKIHLLKGENKLLIKLSNALNKEFLAWAFNLSFEKGHCKL